MSLVVFGLVHLGTAAIFAAIIRFAGGERGRIFKGLSPGMLLPVGVIFGLFVAFVAAQVWNDADRAKAAVNIEARRPRGCDQRRNLLEVIAARRNIGGK